MSKKQRFLGIADIIERWCYSRQGVHNLVKTKDFPKPYDVINKGRNPFWTREDIVAYEIKYPEVRDDTLKHAKVRGYYKAYMRGEGAEE